MFTQVEHASRILWTSRLDKRVVLSMPDRQIVTIQRLSLGTESVSACWLARYASSNQLHTHTLRRLNSRPAYVLNFIESEKQAISFYTLSDILPFIIQYHSHCQFAYSTDYCNNDRQH